MSVLPKLLNWNVNNRFLCPVSGWPLQVSSVHNPFSESLSPPTESSDWLFSFSEGSSWSWLDSSSCSSVSISPETIGRIRRKKWGRITIIERHYRINFGFKLNTKYWTSLDIPVLLGEPSSCIPFGPLPLIPWSLQQCRDPSVSSLSVHVFTYRLNITNESNG